MELDARHKNAWIAFVVAHEVILKQIDLALADAGHISHDVYEVLLALEEAPARQMIMSELAQQVYLSRSGVTRLIDRLEKIGYVKRASCPSDRRALYAVLMEKGLAAREAAWPTYRQAIAEHFAAHISDDDAGQMTRTLVPLTGGRRLIGFEET